MVGDHFVGSDGRSWRIVRLKYLYRGWGDKDVHGEWQAVAEIDPSPTLEWLQVSAQGPVDQVGYLQAVVTENLPPDAEVTLSHAVHLAGGARAVFFMMQEVGLYPEEIT